MKKYRILSLVMACVLFLSAVFTMADSATAVGYEKIVGWEFGGSDSYPSDWGRGGYTAANVQPVISIADGRLRMEVDYTPAASTTYNRAMAQYNFTESAQMDLSEAVRVTFDYYCKPGEEPSQFMAVFSGKLSADVSSTTVTASGKLADLAEKQETSDLEGYDLYKVTLPLSNAETDATQRSHTARMQLGEIRTNNTYQGTVYFDDIMFWKESGEAVPVSAVSLSDELAVYGKAITATAEKIDGTVSWQWYAASSYDLADAEAIAGAESTAYTPSLQLAGGWIYCVADNGATQVRSPAVRVAVADTLKETPVPYSTTAVDANG